MIHPSAIVDPSANLDSSVEVGPFSVIGPGVNIDAGCKIGPHVVINGPTTLGRNNRIFQFASVGEACQDLKYKDEPTQLIVGDNNTIREGVTLHRGTIQDEGLTRVGSNNLLMAYVHVAHDCRVGDNIIIANNSALAGHVRVGNGVILGGGTLVHQFCQIGAYSMTAAGTVVFQDIPAFIMASGNRAHPHGMNFEGMRRRGQSEDSIARLRAAYKLVYRQGLNLDAALEKLPADSDPMVELFRQSLLEAKRGIIR